MLPFPPRVEGEVSPSVPPWEGCAMSLPGHGDDRGGNNGAPAGNEKASTTHYHLYPMVYRVVWDYTTRTIVRSILATDEL